MNEYICHYIGMQQVSLFIHTLIYLVHNEEITPESGDDETKVELGKQKNPLMWHT